MQVLPEATWRARARAHARRVDDLTAGHQARRRTGQRHPVEDFLFTYYPIRLAQLRRWHPGPDVLLAGADPAPGDPGWRHYRPASVDANNAAVGHPVGRSLRDAGPAEATVVTGALVDAAGFVAAHGEAIARITALLRATAGRAGAFGCFGMHEWAMVYRSQRPRHDVALRLGSSGTDAVVESHRLGCTHFDAFRFFTADAAVRNAHSLSRGRQQATEQPGCLHANMDLYKWAAKLGPLVPGELLVDCFALARDIRVVDMRASPYDLQDWGYEPIPVETPAGKAAYAAAQRSFAERAAPLRDRLAAIGGMALTAPAEQQLPAQR